MTSVPLPASRRLRSVLLASAAVLAVCGALLAPVSAHAAPPTTVVSLTFDDGDANQTAALPILSANGMKATFFIVSGYVGAPGYLSRANLDSIKAAGHEIGGHTVSHPDLASVSVDEAKRQICTDRQTLSSWGFATRSFAYPFASSTTAVEQAAKACGYRSARLLGDLASRFGCDGCPFAETLRPRDPFATRALPQVEPSWTLDDLKQGVLNAEKAGGWVQFTFHDVCENTCTDLAVSPTVLGQFLAWLKPRSAQNTTVKTVGDVVGGTVAPLVSGPVVPPAPAGVNGIVNPSMETAGAGGDPSCWMRGGWGQNSPAFSLAGPAHTGAVASRIVMSGYASGDAKLLPQFDLGQCAPTVVAGHTYSLRGFYTSTTVTQFAVYLRNTQGAWVYWTSSPWFPAATSYTQAGWTTPAIPSGYTGISFALTVFANGTLVTDDLALYDSVGAPALPGAVAPNALSRQSAPAPSGQVEVYSVTGE